MFNSSKLPTFSFCREAEIVNKAVQWLQIQEGQSNPSSKLIIFAPAHKVTKEISTAGPWTVNTFCPPSWQHTGQIRQKGNLYPLHVQGLKLPKFVDTGHFEVPKSGLKVSANNNNAKYSSRLAGDFETVPLLGKQERSTGAPLQHPGASQPMYFFSLMTLERSMGKARQRTKTGAPSRTKPAAVTSES